MGTDEVLEHGHTLLKVADNRVLDGVVALSAGLLRLGHKASHTAELLDLAYGTAGSGVEHHIHRVEALLVSGNLLLHYPLKLVVDGGPEVDDLVVALVVGDEAHLEVALDLGDLLVAVLDHSVFLARDDNVTEVEGQTSLEGHGVSEVLDVVEELGGT